MSVQAVEAFALREWEILKNSRTVRGLVAIEGLALGAFVQQLVEGQVEFSFASLKNWIVAQIALIVVFLVRQAIAGLEVQLHGLIPPEKVAKIEAAGYERAMLSLAKSHPEAADALRNAALNPSPALPEPKGREG